MFKLHLDLRMHFIPPMVEHGGPFILTREIELPFAPVEGQRVFSKTFDDCPSPMGFDLKNIVWDIDREVFLADTEAVHEGHPMPFIPGFLATWVGFGWRLGSYNDDYENDGADEAEESCAGSEDAAVSEVDDEDSAEKARLLTWNRRKKSINRVFKALIRHMATNYNNSSAAYAFDRTGRFFTEEEIKERHWKDPQASQFTDTRRAFERMSFEEQQKWRDRTQKYPSIEDLVRELL